MTYFVYGPKAQFFDNNGEMLVGGQVWIYTANTTTLKDSYSNYADAAAQTNPQTNPIILDARGECTIAIASGAIAIALESSDVDPGTGHGTQIWTIPYFDCGDI